VLQESTHFGNDTSGTQTIGSLLKFDSNNALVGRIDYLDAEQQYVLGDRDLGEGDQTENHQKAI
jgi:hypothetical protein